MSRVASRFSGVPHLRREGPLTVNKMARIQHSVLSEDAHASRSLQYANIPTIVTQTDSVREHTRHMLRLRRAMQKSGHPIYANQLLTPCRCEDKKMMYERYFKFYRRH